MKTVTLIFCALTCLSSLVVGQTIVFEEDFESYSNNDKITEVGGDNWRTWSNTPSEDAPISQTRSVSGTNSLHISNGVDVVLLPFNGILDQGRYRVSFNMFVDEGFHSLFNLLHSFDGDDSSWAFQTYSYPDSTAIVDAGNFDALAHTQNTGEWFKVFIVLDLEDDFATFYNENHDLISWNWSKGIDGESNSFVFEAINFYAWDEEGDASFYIDDIKIELMDKSTLDITASINPERNIEIDWTDVGNDTEYGLTNNGEVVIQTMENFYLFERPYPTLHEFDVLAHRHLYGYVFSSGAQEIIVEGGTKRNIVIFEGITGTWSDNCPAAARGLEELKSNDLNVGVINYHFDDEFENMSSLDRIDYYNISSYPTTKSDGEHSIIGGGLETSNYQRYLIYSDQRNEKLAIHELDIDIVNLGSNTFEINISAEELVKYYDEPVNLRIALTESHIPENWFGLDEVNSVCRAMIPDANGTVLTFDANNKATFQETFTLDPSYDIENCAVVAFLQVDDTKEILNGAVFDLSQFSSTVTINDTEIRLSPIPVQDVLKIEGMQNGNAQIIGQNGNIVRRFAINNVSHSEPLSDIQSGVYFIRLQNEDGEAVKKIVKL